MAACMNVIGKCVKKRIHNFPGNRSVYQIIFIHDHNSSASCKRWQECNFITITDNRIFVRYLPVDRYPEAVMKRLRKFIPYLQCEVIERFYIRVMPEAGLCDFGKNPEKQNINF